MKILIATDMEGITGVVDWKHVDSTHAEYQRFRRMMTADVNAAIAGAAEGGAEEILVADGHGYMKNILIEDLDGRACINSGSPSPFSMVQGVDSGIQGAFFIGYHAHMSTLNAILAHTWSSSTVSNVWLNDRLVGEIGLNASVCGSFGVPVLLISGDRAACEEASEWVPGIETVPVKVANGRYGAECLPPSVTHPMITAAARKAVEDLRKDQSPAPLSVETPVRITIEYLNTAMADSAAILPIVKRLDGRRIELQADDMPSAYRFFRAAVALALSA